MALAKELNRPPNSLKDTNKWADYIELLCLASIDNIISSDEIYDKLYGDKSDDEVINDESDLDIDDDTSNSEKTDLRKSKINDIFEFLLSRKGLYQEFYPYEISNSPHYLRLKEKTSYKQYSYLGLLVSSNLDYLKNHTPHLTRSFEENSMFVFKHMLPNNSKIEYFGKGNERGSVFSANKLTDRIIQLSKSLNLPTSSIFNENLEEIDSNNTGDGGLDLVGWFDVFDRKSGKIVNLAQCACGKDWFNKQFDLSEAKWDNYIQFTHPYIKTLFTPSSYRNYDGDWFKKTKIYDCIIVDRLRFLKSLRKRENSKVAHSNMAIVDEFRNKNIDYFS